MYNNDNINVKKLLTLHNRLNNRREKYTNLRIPRINLAKFYLLIIILYLVIGTLLNLSRVIAKKKYFKNNYN